MAHHVPRELGGARLRPASLRDTDTSRNSLIIALLTGGEGWHNNHHHYQASARQGFFWWEIDLTYYGLKVMSWLGIVKDLKAPPARVLRPEPEEELVAA